MDPEPQHESSNNHHQYARSDEWTLQELLILLRRGKWTILIATAAVVVLVGLYTILSSSVYEATAVVQIENNPKTGITPLFDFTGSGVSTKIANELEVLKSVSMTEAVARALVGKRNLDGDKLRAISVIVDHDVRDSLPRIAPLTVIVKRLAQSVEFTPVKESDVIKIAVRNKDPEEAALIANVYTQTYADRNVNTSRKKSHAVREFLQSLLATKHAQLDTTERQLQDYMRRSGVVALDEEAKKKVEQMAELEASRDALDVDVTSKEQALASLKEQLAREEPNVAKVMGEANDAYVKLLQEQIAKLEVERDVALTQARQRGLGETELYQNQFKGIDLQIVELKKNLQDRADKLVGSLLPSEQRGGTSDISGAFVSSAKQKIIEQAIELDGLKAKKAALNAVILEAERQFNQIPAKSIELAKLQRARLSTEKLYLLVEEKFNEAAITETSEFGSVNVIDSAVVPAEPVSPKRGLNMALSLLLGLGAGIAIVLVKGSMDTRLRSPDDLKKLGVSPLGIVQRVDRQMLLHFNGGGQTVANRSIDPRIVVYHKPITPPSEAYRRLRSSVQDAVAKNQIQTIVVTSARPEEGKSTVVANLAATYAHSEERVLLVDADFHRPVVHRLFGLSREPGLAEILLGESIIDDSVNRRVIGDLDVLTCGCAVKNPSDLLDSSRMARFLADAQSKYTLAFLDSPPLLAVADAGILARLVDGMILVVQAGVTTVEMLEHTSDLLSAQKHNVMGVVLNGFDAMKAYCSHRYAYKTGYADYRYNSNGGKTKSERVYR
jgi:capsular exopolysaccharide synthesis family protein